MHDQWSLMKAALAGFVAGSLMYVVFGPAIGIFGPSELGTDLLEFTLFAGSGALSAIAVAIGRNRSIRRRIEQLEQERKIRLDAWDNRAADDQR